MYSLIYTLICYLTTLFTGSSTRREAQRAYAYNRTHPNDYTYRIYRAER